ncbi:MAG TPA: O-antigen ligase family protein [Phycisphaerales bacterium]
MSTGAIDREAIRLRLIERLSAVFVAAILALAMLKATTPSVAFPGWDLDPAVIAGPVIGLGPTTTLGIDIAIVALSGATLSLCAAAGVGVAIWRWALLLTGLASIAWHARLAPTAAQDHMTLGASWAAAMSACVALSATARFAGVARLAAGVLLGGVAFLALKAGVQVLIENPQTIEMFKANRESMLAAQGWTPDSFAARAFERRLYDAPGTGWLGLSNVLATAGACAAVASIALVMTARRVSVATLLALVSGVSILIFAGSKGGWAAAALGVAAIVVWPWLRRTPRVAPWVLLALPLLALAAVGLRGIVGERIGELSLFFRAQYLAAAARIFVEHPLLGVGPAGFKDAYLLAKSPLNPEEITSPHSVFFDFAATLGIGGLAWSVLLLSPLLGTRRLGEAARDDATDSSIDECRTPLRLALLTLAGVTIAGSWVEIEISSPSNVLVRVGGLLIACWIAADVVRRVPLAHVRFAAALAAAVGMTHGMIELTPVQGGSACLLLCLVGLAGATDPVRAAPARLAAVRAAPGLALCGVALAASAWIAPLSRWESLLRSGAASMGQAPTFIRALTEAQDPGFRALVLRQLHDATGAAVGNDADSIKAAITKLRLQGMTRGLTDLVAAIAAAPSDSQTRESASRVALQLAALHTSESSERRDLRQRAIQIAADATTLPLRRAASQAWLANVLRGAADLGGDPTLRTDALQALERAAALDPWNSLHPSAAATLAQSLGQSDTARRWAARALELDANMRLDPLRRLDPAERTRLEAIVSGP